MALVPGSPGLQAGFLSGDSVLRALLTDSPVPGGSGIRDKGPGPARA